MKTYKLFHQRIVLLAAVSVCAISFTAVARAAASPASQPAVSSSQPARADAQASSMVASKRIMADPSVEYRAARKSAKAAATTAVSRTATAALPGITPPKISLSLYVDPILASQGRPHLIASRPIATWLGGWSSNVQADVNSVVSRATAADQVAALVAYNIPVRDCGLYSAGGASSSENYRAWIREFAAGIGARKAIVILEPDALPGLDCLTSAGQAQRLSDLSYAVSVLAGTGANTYLDAGNYSWHPVSTMATRLKSAGVANARGFSLNVSGYGWTDRTISYGQQLVAAIGGGKGFVMDTSRNGQGPTNDNQWCNPRGRGLGKSPTTSTGVASLDAYLWVKVPGESDGECGGAPAAGEWWPEIADELIRNARL